MKKKFFTAVSLVVILAIMGGCATIFKGPNTKVDLGSEPAGASVYVNGTFMGTTPVQLKLESKKSYTFEFRKDGYESKTVVVPNSVGAGWIILDILGGLVPVIVDAATGAWYNLDQKNVNAVLEQQK